MNDQPQNQTAMKSVELSSLVIGSTASHDYYGTNGGLLISKGTLVTSRHIDILSQRKDFELFIPLTENDEIDLIMSGANRVLRTPIGQMPVPPHGLTNNSKIKEVSPGKAGLIELSNSALVRDLNEGLHAPSLADQPAGLPIARRSTQLTVADRTDQYKGEIEDFYQSALKKTRSILMRLAANASTISSHEVENIVRRFVKIFVTDRNILLSIAGTKTSESNYLFHHSLNVCLLAINVAASCGYSEQQVVEIGMGALLHDIGMLLMPEAIRTKQEKYSDDDWYEIQKHPMLGLHLLEKMKPLADKVLYVSYQIHERENGKGYPQQLSGRWIHRYAKIVQIADIYEALTSQRPHRPSCLPFEGLRKIILMSRTGFIANEIVTSFVQYVSLFPVGSLVRLNTGAVARVVHANRDAPGRPHVSVLIDEKGNRYGKADIVQLDLDRVREVQIVAPLQMDSVENLGLLEGF
jgi:HD-GYP domain-containing protein (c-di-GMP phosphodiesterase class II)